MNAAFASPLKLNSCKEHGKVREFFGAEMARYLDLALGSPARTRPKIHS